MFVAEPAALLRVLNAPPLAQLETSSAAQGSGIAVPQALARSAEHSAG
jgi:hypothetical protein